MIESKEPIIKAPIAVLDIGLNWNKLLKNSLDSIETSVWTCDNPDIVITRQQISGSTTSCVISGGVEGFTYKVFNTVTTTSSDLIDSRYFVVLVKNTQVS